MRNEAVIARISHWRIEKSIDDQGASASDTVDVAGDRITFTSDARTLDSAAAETQLDSMRLRGVRCAGRRSGSEAAFR